MVLTGMRSQILEINARYDRCAAAGPGVRPPPLPLEAESRSRTVGRGRDPGCDLITKEDFGFSAKTRRARLMKIPELQLYMYTRDAI